MRTMVQLVVGIVIASVLVANQVAEAQQSGGLPALKATTALCSTAVFSGTYNITSLSMDAFNSPHALFINGLTGTILLDGSGNGTFQAVNTVLEVDLSHALVVTSSTPQSFSFTYSVNSDCTGTVTQSNGGIGTFTGVPGGALGVTGPGFGQGVELGVFIRR